MIDDRLTDDTARVDPIPVRVAEARRIQARYGATTVWFGYFTREWWALVDKARLVEGATPDRLGEAIMAARRRSS
ncbi:hypothetical protein BZB76_0719 [Actinomadura pelletieri DSM 43383]|uniref:Uncharacterized protein n=1 Tax=Actinomadura pelletieri DSM 43383 TaxID=1120940 RepID=A0A495QYY5_9ACTN|nr:hypothetical protein [Actinomadura pelletieri]RKS79267.1 hypothetical protein BZB76_0719 [Actinomadura pelletieri DSM 43383]